MNLAEKYGIDLSTPGKIACPRCRRRGRDNSGNNLNVYGIDKGAYCFGCQWTIPSAAHMEAMGWEDEDESEEVVTRVAITEEENQRIKDSTTTDGQDWRGIRRATNQFFGVRYEIDPETGEPCKQFVPTTVEGKLVGYRVRKFPKDFSGGIGQVGKEVDMVGEFRFKLNTKVCVLTGGETKLLNTYQMLKDDLFSKGKADWEAPAVVCSTLGETGAYKQVKSRYKFFNQFDRIIVCMDADDAGEAATEEICKALPKGKAYVMKMRYKDADDYVEAGAERDFITDFWKGYNNPYVPAGIVKADSIYKEIVERAKVEKLPFPPMLKKLNKALAGGVNYGYIVNILAGSGAGKSSLVNQCCAYWMKVLGVKVGVVSIEAEAAEYGENLLGHIMQRKISLIEDKDERVAFVSSQAAEDAANDLFFDANGNPVLFLIDDRGDYSSLQEKIEELIISCDVRVVLIDVLSDVFAGMSIEQIDLWMAWEKKIVKQYNAILINVAHTRKGGSGDKSASQGKFLTEESIIGSGTQYRSAGVNIALQRDKTAEDEVERNTTMVNLLKSRSTGVTGPVCELFYDIQTHTLWDKEEYMKTTNKTF